MKRYAGLIIFLVAFIFISIIIGGFLKLNLTEKSNINQNANEQSSAQEYYNQNEQQTPTDYYENRNNNAEYANEQQEDNEQQEAFILTMDNIKNIYHLYHPLYKRSLDLGFVFATEKEMVEE